ncbi:group II intron maturase-specific domain-containing protein [Moorena sp. SIO4G3]|uniref:group II intron reverse transcriptase n=1 Tax=Moorena sp. SIO4G3 TaxID=2607821 RepID=UPI00342DFD81
MEMVIKTYARNKKNKKGEKKSKDQRMKSISLIRYADDFIILHKDQDMVEECQRIIIEWLSDMGLELKPSKTKMTHTSKGFNFLGFNIRQYPAGKNQSKLGFKTIIKPSKEKVLEHYGQLADIIDRHKAAPQAALISRLKPVIRGWCNYYSTVCSKETFKDLEYLLWNKLQRWGYRRHPNKSKTWVINKYWGTVKKDNWMFMDGENYLPKHAKTKIVRHIKIKDTKSPFNGDLIYWNTRMGKHPEINSQKGRLLKRQKGKCAHCGLIFRDGDLMEKHHIIPRSLGGTDLDKNLELLHLHCHDVKHGMKINLKELDGNPF